MDDAFFIAGVALYWGEGSKTRSDLSLANADPRALRLFIDWVRIHHDSSAEFVLKINLHADNDEPAARRQPTFRAWTSTGRSLSQTERDTGRIIYLTASVEYGFVAAPTTATASWHGSMPLPPAAGT